MLHKGLRIGYGIHLKVKARQKRGGWILRMANITKCRGASKQGNLSRAV